MDSDYNGGGGDSSRCGSNRGDGSGDGVDTGGDVDGDDKGDPRSCGFRYAERALSLIVISNQLSMQQAKSPSPLYDRLVGLVVLTEVDPEFYSRFFRRDFAASSHTSDFKIGTPVATLPGAWRYRVSAGPGVSIL